MICFPFRFFLSFLRFLSSVNFFVSEGLSCQFFVLVSNCRISGVGLPSPSCRSDEHRPNCTPSRPGLLFWAGETTRPLRALVFFDEPRMAPFFVDLVNNNAPPTFFTGVLIPPTGMQDFFPTRIYTGSHSFYCRSPRAAETRPIFEGYLEVFHYTQPLGGSRGVAQTAYCK